MIALIKAKAKEEFRTLRSLVCEEKFFLIALVILTVTFAVSMFYESAIYVSVMLMLLISVFFNLEKNLSMLLFSYPFCGIFIVGNAVKINLFTYIYSIVFVICFVKYFIDVYKGKKQINKSLMFPLFAFLFYIALPIHEINIMDMAKYIIFCIAFYLVVLCKKEIKINRLVFFAAIGLIISCLFAGPARQTARMPEILGEFKGLWIVKFQGLFTNINMLAAYSAILFPFIIGNSFKKNGIFWFLIFIPLLCFSYQTLSRLYLICLAVMIVYYFLSTCVIKDKRRMISYFAIILIVLGVVVYFDNFTIRYSGRFSVIGNEVQTPDVNDSDLDEGDYWIDGTPNDSGRWNLWKRYTNDYFSSPEKILFGSGISAGILGQYPHNGFIEYIWRLGLFGGIIGIFAFVTKFLINFKNFRRDETNAFGLVMGIIIVLENIHFGITSIILTVLFIVSSGGEYSDIFGKFKSKNLSYAKI